MDEDIERRLSRLSPEAQKLFWDIERRGEETEFRVPADELVVNLYRRMIELAPEDRAEFVALFGVMGHKYHEEGLRLQAEGLRFEGFAKLIERAKELDRRAGRPVNERMTLGEAIPKLEAAGELGVLERAYLDSVRDELVWFPVPEDDDELDLDDSDD